jgi:hypothetical protein
MKIVLETVAIFLICFAVSLVSTLYALITRRLALVKSMVNFGPTGIKTRAEWMADYGFMAPFALFPLGAVVQNQLHRALLTPAAGLLVATVFIAYPFVARLGWALIDQEWLDRRTRNLPWNRPRKR